MTVDFERTTGRNKSIIATRSGGHTYKKGLTVLVEGGAGEKAFASDTDYEVAGAQIATADEIIADG